MTTPAERWGYMLNSFRDQMNTAHLLKDDNSPACGVSYYASPGAHQDIHDNQKCRRCKAIAAKRARKNAAVK